MKGPKALTSTNARLTYDNFRILRSPVNVRFFPFSAVTRCSGFRTGLDQDPTACSGGSKRAETELFDDILEYEVEIATSGWIGVHASSVADEEHTVGLA
jgi:hypothetical protein